MNHGGGYAFRLCKSDRELTEACFAETPLRFVGNTSDIVGPSGQTFYTIPAARFTTPTGAEWTRNPVPDMTAAGDLPNFPPPVPGMAGHCCDDGCLTEPIGEMVGVIVNGQGGA